MRVNLEQLAELDRVARAYGFEVGRGKPLAPSIDSSEDNPFLDPNWRDQVKVIPTVVAPEPDKETPNE